MPTMHLKNTNTAVYCIVLKCSTVEVNQSAKSLTNELSLLWWIICWHLHFFWHARASCTFVKSQLSFSARNYINYFSSEANTSKTMVKYFHKPCLSVSVHVVCSTTHMRFIWPRPSSCVRTLDSHVDIIMPWRHWVTTNWTNLSWKKDCARRRLSLPPIRLLRAVGNSNTVAAQWETIYLMKTNPTIACK